MEEVEETDPGDEEYWKVEDFKDCSKSYVSDGKLSWIWRNKVNLGKKLVVTGVVVSSAPFVLPPLLALSAIGLACSVPAGFLCLTYVCGEKLLNTLLPMPSSTPYEENEPMYSDVLEEYKVYGDDVDKGYEEDEDIEVEEKYFEEDTRKEIEMGVELVKENSRETNDHDQISATKDELDKRSLTVSEVVEEGGYEEDVGEYIEDEEQPLDSIMIPDILEGIREAENEISLMEKEEGGMPRDSLKAIVLEAQVGGENENNVEQVIEDIAFVGGENEINVELGRYEEDVGEHMEDDEQPLDSRTPSEVLNEINEGENEISFVEKEEGEIPRGSCKAIVVESPVGRENDNNTECVREDMSNNENSVEQVRVYEEDVGEHMMEDEKQPLNSKIVPHKAEGIKETENEFAFMEEEQGGIPNNSSRAVVVEGLEAQVDGENENYVEQVMEDMTFVPPRDILEENGFMGNVAGIEEDELRRETTGLIEEMRDEGKNDRERKDSPEKETLEENEESGSVFVNDTSDDMGNKNLTVIPEEPEPAMDDKGVIDGPKSDVYLDNMSIERDRFGVVHEEPKSAVEDQLVVNVKIDDGHTVTEIHRGICSDKLGALLLSNESREIADESGFDMSNNGTVAPDQNADSLDKMPEEDDQSSNEVEVRVEYHEVVIESSLAVSALDQGTAACSDKIKLDEEKIWEQINAVRTIVGYKDTPHPSCAEELNALYVFTGVEPPASSKNPDLADINEKLHFLMSIVGVK